MVQRYFFELAYDGTKFFGWQIQPREISVQQTIEEALTKLNSNREVKVVGCGRTDTGVHASNFYLHVDFPEIKQQEKFLFKLNRMLPDAIAVAKIIKVKSDAHARFDALERTYQYFISTQKKPFNSAYTYLVSSKLNIDAMNKACAYLIGEKDFTSLAKMHTDVKTNICNVRFAQWKKTNEDTLMFEIKANRFLRNMVRATVGTLLEVGLQKIKPEEVKEILDAKSRSRAKASAPGHALFLSKVEYNWKNIQQD
ncbi:MAG: tRNA pseudouridine(38-40) synthase TruA [Lishizhenia sp.]